MDKAGVRGNISEFDPDIAASVAQGLIYVFGESNSYACHGAPGACLVFSPWRLGITRALEVGGLTDGPTISILLGVSNTAGAAIWALDYALQAATHNITRVFFHEGIGYKYDLVRRARMSTTANIGRPLRLSFAVG